VVPNRKNLINGEGTTNPMLTDKELKKRFKAVASESPDKYYATEALRSEGFMRKQCTKCSRHFWTVHKGQHTCGDAACLGKVDIFNKPPVKKKLDFIDVWLGFKKFFEARGYRAIPRYPVISRWNPTTDFTNASIAAFQPYVISGESEPPAKKLIIPQFCLRFGDVDNVGVTGSHCTGFVMIGQHMFVEPKEWSQNQAFRDIYEYITQEVGIPKEELTLHEDSWAGGGNFGPCMEFFSRGVELFNQVYMMFEQTDYGDKELNIKVLDMGLGMERVAWFSQGSLTIYDAAFPTIIHRLKKKLNVEFDTELYKKFAPLAPKLNFDEVEDIDSAWAEISKTIKIPVGELKAKIMPMTALYSIAEHARALLFAISDGGLPSNVGGYYNLRVIFRRAMDFIQTYRWDIDLADIAAWHADYLEPIYPDLSKNIEDVRKILAVEKEKYFQNKKKGAQIIANLLKNNKSITTEKLIELYDSQGITPEQIRLEAHKEGKKIDVPDNFYSLVAEKHEQAEQKTQTRKEKELDIKGVPNTTALYFESYDYVNFEATVIRIIDDKFVVLDRTAFYPTSGGQLHDIGTLHGAEVADVFKQSGVIIHAMKEKPKFREGDVTAGAVDMETRLQLAQHHTSAHIINGCARILLGNHIWQAGAAKSLEKARLDITHYEALTEDEMKKIEKMANKVIDDNIPVYKTFMPRAQAEAKYGFVLYQGGAVPGKEIRVVSIEGLDVEACGGTHLNLTGEAKIIKLLKSTKLQDGVVRIEFTAGEAAERIIEGEKKFLEEASSILGVKQEYLPGRAAELFEKWKKTKKMQKGTAAHEQLKELELTRLEKYAGKDILSKIAEILQTQPEHVNKTITRFKKELEERADKSK
jgi:alanyl-tRNA synthetase